MQFDAKFNKEYDPEKKNFEADPVSDRGGPNSLKKEFSSYFGQHVSRKII